MFSVRIEMASLATGVPPTENSSIISDFTAHCLLIIFGYGLIILISLCGNSLVCFAIITKKSDNSTNYLIANLAFSDILMTLLNIPITVMDILLRDWIFGEHLCHVVSFITAVCVYVSSFTMLTIAVNRYYVVYHNRKPLPPKSYINKRFHSKSNKPTHLATVTSKASNCSQISPINFNKKRQSAAANSMAATVDSKCFNVRLILVRLGHCLRPSKLGLTIVLIWLFAILNSIPFLWNYKLIIIKKTNNLQVRRCFFITEQPFNELILTLFVFITQYLIPLVTSAVIYIRIGITISRLGQVTQNLQKSVATGTGNTPTTQLAPSIPTTVNLRSSFSGASITLPPNVYPNSSVLLTSQAVGQLSPQYANNLIDAQTTATESRRSTRTKMIYKNKRRRICLLTLIVLIFALTWFPFHTYFILKDLNLIEANNKIFLICHWLAMSSVIYNPFVYFWLNESFRSDTEKIFQNLFSRDQPKLSQMNLKNSKTNENRLKLNKTKAGHNEKIDLEENLPNETHNEGNNKSSVDPVQCFLNSNLPTFKISRVQSQPDCGSILIEENIPLVVLNFNNNKQCKASL